MSAGYQVAEDPGFLREALVLAAGMSAALAGNNMANFHLNYEQARSLGWQLTICGTSSNQPRLLAARLFGMTR